MLFNLFILQFVDEQMILNCCKEFSFNLYFIVNHKGTNYMLLTMYRIFYITYSVKKYDINNIIFPRVKV